MSVTDWGTGVRDVLGRAGTSERALAEGLNLSRMALNRYLRGERTPDARNVRAINRAVARLIEIPEAADYLFALALRSKLLQPEDGDIALGGVLALLRSFDRYFISGARDAIRAAFSQAQSDEVAQLAIFARLSSMRGKRLLGKLDGRLSSELAIDEVVWLFRESGVPLDPWLRLDEETRVARVRDRLAMMVEAEIVRRAELDSGTRTDLTAALLRLFDDASNEVARVIHAGDISRAVLSSVPDVNTAEAGTASRPFRKEKGSRHED